MVSRFARDRGGMLAFESRRRSMDQVDDQSSCESETVVTVTLDLLRTVVTVTLDLLRQSWISLPALRLRYVDQRRDRVGHQLFLDEGGNLSNQIK